MRGMAERLLVLFAREPRRQALEKGLAGRAGEQLFTAFAHGWVDAARRAGARLAVAAPRADCAGWQRCLSGTGIAFLEQRGSSFGQRLEDSARQAADLGGTAVLVGGDVAPSSEILARAFGLLEEGADAVLAPSPDGGVSLVALPAEDLDLLRRIAPRRFDVFFLLSESLRARGRRVRLVAAAPDVDGRRQLGRLLRTPPFSSPGLKALAREALDPRPWSRSLAAVPPRSHPESGPDVSRAPPFAS
jgi:glycosyltransferase A (GT-A) superfamily protein (DUF2064 family)